MTFGFPCTLSYYLGNAFHVGEATFCPWPKARLLWCPPVQGFLLAPFISEPQGKCSTCTFAPQVQLQLRHLFCALQGEQHLCLWLLELSCKLEALIGAEIPQLTLTGTSTASSSICRCMDMLPHNLCPGFPKRPFLLCLLL